MVSRWSKHLSWILTGAAAFLWGSVAYSDSYLGDVSHDCQIDLGDTILVLQVLSGRVPALPVYSDADINADTHIGMAEALYALRVTAGEIPPSLDCFAWNETAVRKVLQTFAFGGHPTETQISVWADMSPRQAIDEIMTFEPTNDRLSPPDFDDLGSVTDGSLEGLADLLSSESADNHTVASRRDEHDKRSWAGPRYNWLMAVRARGLNTFLHRIGLWETNYHMAVNQGVGIFPYPIIRHYDNITAALSSELPYQQVLARGALNAAVAYQYGHNHNVFIDGVFRGNDDFAREYHQLFFGILGEYDHEYHEAVSIENTARALTGIRASYHPPEEGGPDVEVYFASDVHHADPLEILNHSITGPTAKEKIENLAEVAILHPESLANLPVITVRALADDNLTTEKIAAIRSMWQSLPEKDLLEFLKVYAISEVFHASDRIKYHSSFARQLFLHNQMLLSNWELYAELNNVRYLLENDDIVPFYPVHNVFGHQTGAEAYASPAIFKHAYNRSTDQYWYWERLESSEPAYRKEWREIIPKSPDDTYRARDVARWLWQRFVADGWKNYGILEQAHLCMLLTTGRDLGSIMYENLAGQPHPDTVYYPADFSDPQSEAAILLESYANMALDLDNVDAEDRERANRYVQRAIAFIAATPYTFLQEGR